MSAPEIRMPNISAQESFAKIRAAAGQHGKFIFLILLTAFLLAGTLVAMKESARDNLPATVSDMQTAMQVAQYPAGLQTVIVRMLISKSATVDELAFNPDTDFGPGKAIHDINPAILRRAVFHADGGGAVYQQAPAGAMADDSPGTWYYNADFQVPNIGTTSTADNSGNDMIAFLPGVKQAVCQAIDTQVGIAVIPVLAVKLPAGPQAPGIQDVQVFSGAASTFPASSTVGKPIGKSELAGRPFACFQNGAGGLYVYYHVLIER